jgi:DNA repair protein RecO (recombination protein O)
MAYFQRENRELVSLDSCELIRSQFNLVSDYHAGVALDYFAEVAEQLLPAEEPGEKFFRLLLAVLDDLRPPQIWRAVTYFSLWAVRLSGWLPELHACLGCGSALEASDRSFFSRGIAGLSCLHCRNGSSWELSPESRTLAFEMLRVPVAQLSKKDWTQSTAADLRRFLVQQIESHADRRLVTARMLEE